MSQTATTLTRVRDGRTVAAPGRYTVDPAHTVAGFVARHLVVTKVRGRFESFQADIAIAEAIEDSSLEVRLDAASITTGNADRDAHLRSPDFFDVEAHPQLVFRSGEIRATGETTWDVEGTLEIKGVAKPLTLHVEFLGEQTDPWGNARLLATARAEIDREDWGLTWNQVLETGNVLVSKKIQIEIEAQAIPA